MNWQFRRYQERDPAGGSTPLATREVLERGRQWVDSGSDSEVLRVRACTLRARTLQSREDATRDLEENQILDSELCEALEASRDGLSQMELALQGLQEALAAQDRGAGAQFLVALEGAAHRVGEAGRAMGAWLEAPVLRCPRCGHGGDSECEPCGLDLLIPDPARAGARKLKVAMLPLPFGAVYQAYLAAVTGEGRLEPLYESLDFLEGEMRTRRRHAEFYGRRMESEAADRLVATVDEVLAGIETMRHGANLRRTHDLNKGWDLIFGAGEQVGDRTASVLDEAGLDPPPSAPCHRGVDSVVLLGE